MTENLAKNLIHLSDGSFSSYRSPELRLNHRKDSLHIRPLMIMLQEGIPIEVVDSSAKKEGDFDDQKVLFLYKEHNVGELEMRNDNPSPLSGSQL